MLSRLNLITHNALAYAGLCKSANASKKNQQTAEVWARALFEIDRAFKLAVNLVAQISS